MKPALGDAARHGDRRPAALLDELDGLLGRPRVEVVDDDALRLRRRA